LTIQYDVGFPSERTFSGCPPGFIASEVLVLLMNSEKCREELPLNLSVTGPLAGQRGQSSELM
jgi:hypothetical protein